MLQNSKEKFGTKVKFVQGRINWTPCKRYLKKKKKGSEFRGELQSQGGNRRQTQKEKKKILGRWN